LPQTVATSKKTRQGLKRTGANLDQDAQKRCNEQENPTGIETKISTAPTDTILDVATSKKTRQGLKLCSGYFVTFRQ